MSNRAISRGFARSEQLFRAWERISTVYENLTPDDFDWLRKLRAATDAKRDPPPIPTAVAEKLCQFSYVMPSTLGGFAITDRGRGALLEQKMRDAEER